MEDLREVDIYDFDKTVVPFDSGSTFAAFCFIRYPYTLFLIPIIAVATILMICRVIKLNQYKKICFSFMPFIPREKAVKKFWDKYEDKVFDWFKNKPREAIVISASPDFLLKEIQERLQFENLICTKHNPKTGVLIGNNCNRNEKVNRFNKEFAQDVKVIDVYSDSIINDQPIFSLASNNCYQIKSGERIQFNYKEKYANGVPNEGTRRIGR